MNSQDEAGGARLEPRPALLGKLSVELAPHQFIDVLAAVERPFHISEPLYRNTPSQRSLVRGHCACP